MATPGNDLNVTLGGGDLQGGLFAEGTVKKEQMPEAQHNRASSMQFQSAVQGKG
jgi:hypothetical protein